MSLPATSRLSLRLVVASALGALASFPACSSPQPVGPKGEATLRQVEERKLRGEPLVAPSTRLAYPKAKTVEQIDDYHGTKVADPYRWLEDVDSEETKAWVAAENEVTFAWLAKIPAREKIKARLTELWNYERFSVPHRSSVEGKPGATYFYSRNDGLQNQSPLYVTESLDSPGRILLDPNGLATDGTVALAGTWPSEDGSLLAYGLSRSGSDWSEWRVRDVKTGEDRPDVLRWIKFSGATWSKDGKGFYYGGYDEPAPAAASDMLKGQNFFQKLRYHELGKPQSEDRLVHEDKEHKDWRFGAELSEDGRWLLIPLYRSSAGKNGILVRDLSKPDSGTRPLIPNFDNRWDFLGSEGETLWFRTDLTAPRGRIVALDMRETDPVAKAVELIPEGPHAIQWVSLVHDSFVVGTLEDAHTLVRVFGLDGQKKSDVALPGVGTASGFDGKRRDRETFYSFTSYTTPSTVYRLDLETGTSTVWKRPRVAFDPEAYETEQVFVASKDGTKIPLWLTHKKGLARDGKAPTYLYGYGGFDIALTPGFSVANLVWLELGGVYAVANLRGGSEYGATWHEAGTKLKKQNVFDDFLACAEWLVAEKVTAREKLAIGGGSNGGLLVGACLTQRPDLFGAACPDVGVLDMLRFHKFTIGWAWTQDYGSSDDPEQFKALRAYSPYHNLKPGTTYPPTFVTTADHDDRVVPGHSFKFAAALQAAQSGEAPVLVRIETKAGHGAGKPTSKVIEATADRWAFLVAALGVRGFGG